MEKITDEVIVSSLFMCGYDAVDPYLYFYVLNKIFNNAEYHNLFEYTNESAKNIYFSNIVECKNGVFKIKDKSEITGLPISFNKNEEYNNPVDFLPRSNALIQLILNLNVREIVRSKLAYYGTSSYYEYDSCFSSMEKEIRKKDFGSSYKSIVEGFDKVHDPVRIMIKGREEDK